MYWREILHTTTGKVKRWLWIAGATFLLVWFVFLDSHSLLSRIQWHREHAQLEQNNTLLRAQILELESRLARRLTDEEVEQIAREEYGMSRPGEVVYTLEEE